jgi:hypothetical protein
LDIPPSDPEDEGDDEDDGNGDSGSEDNHASDRDAVNPESVVPQSDKRATVKGKKGLCLGDVAYGSICRQLSYGLTLYRQMFRSERLSDRSVPGLQDERKPLRMFNADRSDAP